VTGTAARTAWTSVLPTLARRTAGPAAASPPTPTATETDRRTAAMGARPTRARPYPASADAEPRTRTPTAMASQTASTPRPVSRRQIRRPVRAEHRRFSSVSRSSGLASWLAAAGSDHDLNAFATRPPRATAIVARLPPPRGCPAQATTARIDPPDMRADDSVIGPEAAESAPRWNLRLTWWSKFTGRWPCTRRRR
jgi:hypothetical protein